MSASEQLFAGMLLPAVARAVCKQAGVRVEDGFSRDGVCALARALKGFRLEVRGVAADARQCQVTRGRLFGGGRFPPETMEARILPGLHVVARRWTWMRAVRRLQPALGVGERPFGRRRGCRLRVRARGGGSGFPAKRLKPPAGTWAERPELPASK